MIFLKKFLQGTGGEYCVDSLLRVPASAKPALFSHNESIWKNVPGMPLGQRDEDHFRGLGGLLDRRRRYAKCHLTSRALANRDWNRTVVLVLMIISALRTCQLLHVSSVGMIAYWDK